MIYKKLCVHYRTVAVQHRTVSINFTSSGFQPPSPYGEGIDYDSHVNGQ